ncbi:MAG: 3-dehydroquinate synthase, partial [Actinobacteria bacterium]
TLAASYVSLLATAGMEAELYTVPDGEEAQQLGVVEDVYDFLNGGGFTRDDLIVGVGGGALTDVAGFVGGTYLRGVPVMYVATTLIAAVDAAIGGKTGVNVGGKNLAGVFAHPEAVLIDIDIIDQLPLELKREGAAEALKTGFIEDLAIVEAYERDGLDVDLDEIVNRSVAVKVAVVNDDFKERGRRAILNYGHTVGHAIETTTGRSHAESVSIGTVAAGAASRAMFDFTGEERQRAVLREVGLPISASDADAGAVRAQMDRDKKRDSEGLRMVLLQDFGIPELVHANDATVRAAFEGIGLA